MPPGHTKVITRHPSLSFLRWRRRPVTLGYEYPLEQSARGLRSGKSFILAGAPSIYRLQQID
jgi:hypothetical protein